MNLYVYIVFVFIFNVCIFLIVFFSAIHPIRIFAIFKVASFRDEKNKHKNEDKT